MVIFGIVNFIQNDIVEDTDVCIIGSDAAGAVLAKELVQAGKSVVLLERGGYYEGKDMNQRETDMMPLYGRMLDLILMINSVLQ